jgi:hypothetical protein
MPSVRDGKILTAAVPGRGMNIAKKNGEQPSPATWPAPLSPLPYTDLDIMPISQEIGKGIFPITDRGGIALRFMPYSRIIV